MPRKVLLFTKKTVPDSGGELPTGTVAANVVPLGAGGFICQMDIAADGSVAIGTDVFNGYIQEPGSTQNRILITESNLPAGFDSSTFTDFMGVYGIRFCRTKSQHIYMVMFNRVLKSSDKGATWQIKSPPTFSAHSNLKYQRNWGPKVAVHPTNELIALVGTEVNGAYYTTNGGDSWTNISLPNGANANDAVTPHLVEINPFNPNQCLVTTHGEGIRMSTTGVAGPYTLMTGTPTTVRHIEWAPNGTLWITTDAGLVYKWTSGGGFSEVEAYIVEGRSAIGIAVDPADSNHIVVTDLDSKTVESIDGGATWLPESNGNVEGGGFKNRRRDTSVAWMDFGPTKPVQFYPSTLKFDPSRTNKLLVAEGLGVMETTPPKAGADWVWNGRNAGIEELVANFALPMAGGKLLVGCWDKPIWNVKTLTAYTNQPSMPGQTEKGFFGHGWHFAQSSSNPEHVVANVAFAGHSCGYSNDYGETWTLFPTQPYTNPTYNEQKAGGAIAVGATTSNVVIMGGPEATPRYTLNGGSTWTDVNIPNAVEGNQHAMYLNRKVLVYDPLLAKFIMVLHPSNTTPGVGGVYQSSTGASWTKVFDGDIPGDNAKYNSQLVLVPGHSGHLLFAADQGHALRRSTNGGANWTAITGVVAYQVAVGAKRDNTKTYPAVYIKGSVNGVKGVFRSEDNLATWQQLAGEYPGGHLDGTSTMAASPDVFGRIFLGFSGSGFRYYDYP